MFSSTSFFPYFLFPAFPGLQIPIVRNWLRKSQIFDHHHSHCFTALLSDEGVQKTKQKSSYSFHNCKFHPLVYGSRLLPSGWRELKSLFFIPSRRRSPGGQAGCYTGIPECCHFLSLCFIHSSNKSQTAGGGGVRRAFICGSWTASADFFFFFFKAIAVSQFVRGITACVLKH